MDQPQRSIPGVSDAELFEQARAGDRAAFGELVERHQQAVFRAAFAALRSREDAEEVAQEAFIAAFQKLGSFRGEASFKTWVLTIAWNRAMDRRRRAGEWLRRFVSRDEEGKLQVRGLFIGDDASAFTKAADLSLKVNFQMLDDFFIDSLGCFGPSIPEERAEIAYMPAFDWCNMRLTSCCFDAKFVHCQVNGFLGNHACRGVFDAQDADQTYKSILFLMIDHRSVTGQLNRFLARVFLIDRQESAGHMLDILQ